MSKAWMPLYVADYLADTAHLSATESGAYLHLIMHYWQTGGLPVDDDKLCRIARVHPPHWQRVRAVLEPFFGHPKTGGLWVQKRVALELNKSAELSNKRKAAALQKHSNSSAIAVQLHTQSQSPSQKEEERAGANAPEARAREPAEFDQWWEEYPHKVGKPAALRSFVAARRKADMNALMDGLARYVLEKPPDRSWCNPATWLNQERWNDQPAFSPPPRGPNGIDRKPPGLVETGLRLVAELEERERRTEGRDGPSHQDGDGPVLLLAPRWR